MQTTESVKRRFLLVDDHTIIRSALKAQCNETYPDAIIEESADGKGIMEMLAANRYQLVILDIQIPNCEALYLIKCIHLHHPQVSVLVYSMTSANIYAIRVMKAGAKGFVSKESSLEELKSAIDLALQGKKYIGQDVAELFSQQSFTNNETPFTMLTPRELQISSLLLSGHTVTDISKLLHIGNSTVGTHKGKIFDKLNVSNLLELKAISDVYKF